MIVILGLLTLGRPLSWLGDNALRTLAPLTKVMRLDNLLSLRYKPFVPRTTDSAHGYEIVCDLTREAMLTAPDHVWVADITYLVMDAFRGKSSAGRSPIISRPACPSKRSTRLSLRAAVR